MYVVLVATAVVFTIFVFLIFGRGLIRLKSQWYCVLCYLKHVAIVLSSVVPPFQSDLEIHT